MLSLPLDQYDAVEEYLYGMTIEHDELFDESLKAFLERPRNDELFHESVNDFLEKPKDDETKDDIAITHLIAQTQKSIYDFVYSILSLSQSIDQENRLTIVHDLAEKGSTWVLVSSTPYIENIQKQTWTEIYRAFDRYNED